MTVHRLSPPRYGRCPLSRDMPHILTPHRHLIIEIEELLIWFALVDWWEKVEHIYGEGPPKVSPYTDFLPKGIVLPHSREICGIHSYLNGIFISFYLTFSISQPNFTLRKNPHQISYTEGWGQNVQFGGSGLNPC